MLPKESKLYRSKSSTSLTHTHTHTLFPEDFLSFQARVMKLSTYILGINIRLFCQIGKKKFPPPLVLGGVKGAIGLIFKIVNFEDRVLKLSAFVLGLNLRLVCHIGKIYFHPSLVLGGLKVQ